MEAEEPLSAKRWVRCGPEQNRTTQVVEDVESERPAIIKALVSVDETTEEEKRKMCVLIITFKKKVKLCRVYPHL